MRRYCKKYAVFLMVLGISLFPFCGCGQSSMENETQPEEPPQSTVNTAQENMSASAEETTLHSLPAAPQEDAADPSDISLFNPDEHEHGIWDFFGQDIQDNPTNLGMVLEKDVIPFEEGKVVFTLINYDNFAFLTDESFGLEYQDSQDGEWFPVEQVRTEEIYECLIHANDEKGYAYSLFVLLFDDYAIDSAYTHYRVTKTIGEVELVQEFTITFDE